MELNEEEKRQLFQVDGDCQAKVLDELYMTARFTRNPSSVIWCGASWQSCGFCRMNSAWIW